MNHIPVALLSRSCLVLLLLAGAACGSHEASPFGYPLDDVLRLNHLQMKGTHNSYHIEPPNPASPDWKYTHLPLTDQLEKQGVRQFELDVHYSSDEGKFTVYHLPTLDDHSTCHYLKDCLTELKSWSDAHPGHHALVVLIEPKDDIDPADDSIVGHYEDLDAELLAVWPRDRVITPDDLKGKHATLAEAVQTDGWPTLGASRGKILFSLLDDSHEPGSHHYNYTHGLKDLNGRAMFVTADVKDPYAAVVKLDDPTATDAIHAAVAAGFFVRTYPGDPIMNGQVTTHAQMDAALKGVAHMISSDYPVDGIIPGYFTDLSPGTPTRCNPLTAPPSCTADAIESPARLQAPKQ